MKPSGRALLGRPSSLSVDEVAVGMGASRTEEGRELATAEMAGAAAEVVVGALPEEPLLPCSYSPSSEEVSTGEPVAVAVAVS